MRVALAAGRAGEPDAELGGLADERHHLGGRDQGLARDTVGEHRRTADPVGVDDYHLRPELNRGMRRLVPAGAASDDHNSRHEG